jgi:DNA-binding IclR family transcriptional regulator
MAIGKTLNILTLFMSETTELSTNYVCKSLNMSKPTASRILNTLTHHGFLFRNPINKKYSLGRRFISLGLNASTSLNYSLINIAKPHIDKLSEEIDATVSFTVLFGSDVTIVYLADKPGPIKFNIYIGEVTSPHAAASAKVVYAFLDPELRNAFLKPELERFTDNTITDHRILMKEYELVRERGYSMDNQEREKNLIAMGVPVFNAENKVMGAIATVGLSIEKNFGPDSPLVPMMQAASKQLSKRLITLEK